MTIYKYGLISDTHGSLHEIVPRAFEGVKAIFHGGDVVGKHVLQDLERIAPVYAVAGNCDDASMNLPLKRVVHFPYGSVGITHGHLLPLAREPRMKQLLAEFDLENTRIIVTGHSHLPALDVRQNVYIINPGAACRPRFSIQPSICILTWDNEQDTLSFSFRAFAWKS